MGKVLTVIFLVFFWKSCFSIGLASLPENKESREILTALIQANDEVIDAILNKTYSSPPGGFRGIRGIGAQVMMFAAAYSQPLSRHHHSDRMIREMEQCTATLQKEQLPDGLFDLGNLDSAPDSSFILKTLCKGQLFLEKDGQKKTAALRDRLKNLLLGIAEGVRSGGVHTPNHRWVICSSLAHVNALYPDKKWVERIDEWLGEGIDMDEDGQWSERSPNYTADVNNPAMIDLAVLLHRSALLDPVRKNLDMSLYHMEVDGEMETVASRRQDQNGKVHKYIYEYYFPYRYMAIHDKNGTYAAVARRIERDFLKELGARSYQMSSALTCMLEYPEMTEPMPDSVPLPENYLRIFPQTSMVRVRRQDTTATIYGGSDWYAGLGHGSGLATNPTFFKMRKGKAVLESIRLSPAFFGTGFFYSQGLRREGEDCLLSQNLRVPYHLPLPKEKRNRQGDYELSADMGKQHLPGRYYSKMSFADRPGHYVTLRTEIRVREKDGGFELEFQVDGYPGVPLTLELIFRPGGSLTGAERTGEMETFLLKEGWGSYTVGPDRLTFGPGSYNQPVRRMESEMITWTGGSMQAEGIRIYLTGLTPWHYTLHLK